MDQGRGVCYGARMTTTNDLVERLRVLERERDEAIAARNRAWREAGDLRVTLDRVRAQLEGARRG